MTDYGAAPAQRALPTIQYRAKVRGCLARSIATRPRVLAVRQEENVCHRQALEQAFPGDWKTAHAEIKVEARAHPRASGNRKKGTP